MITIRKKMNARNERKTYRELLKNKLRAMGMKNPLVMMGDDTPEKQVMKIMTSSSATMASEGYGTKKKKKK